MKRFGRPQLKALLSLDKLTFKPLRDFCAVHQVHQRRVMDAGAYRVSILFSHVGSACGRFLVKLGADIIAELPVSSQQRFTSYLVQVPQEGLVTVFYEPLAGKGPIIVGLGVRKVADLPKTAELVISPQDVCAALATYPARAKLLKRAIDSLYPQVDHLFVYLNNYRHVPEYFLEYDTGKLHYILDTESELRASAKFFWLKRYECYWATCDDDIIYPPDYLLKLKEAHALLGGRAIVGVHGTRFEQHFSNCYGSRVAELPFEAGLDSMRRVHMLGTGTVLLHSKQLRDDDCNLLLSRPTENDETLALICRIQNIPQFAIQRSSGWMVSHPLMTYGIFEETMLNPMRQASSVALLAQGNPWPQLELDT